MPPPQAGTTTKVRHDDNNAIMHSVTRAQTVQVNQQIIESPVFNSKSQTVQVNQQIIESPVFNSKCFFSCYILYSPVPSNNVGHILFTHASSAGSGTTSKVRHDDNNAIMQSVTRAQTVQLNQQIIASPVLNSKCFFNCYILYPPPTM
jgi:hypothetical protein